MIEDLLYKCPFCGVADALRTTKKETRCTYCRTTIQRRGRELVVNGQARNCAEWYDQIKMVVPEVVEPGDDPVERGELLYQRSKTAVLRQAQAAGPFESYTGIRAELEFPREIDRGCLVVSNKRLRFLGERNTHSFPLTEITCVTTDSHYFVFKAKGKPYFQIRFLEESPLKYEDLCRIVIQEYWLQQGKSKIVEFQPRIVFEFPRRRRSRILPVGTSDCTVKRRPLESIFYVAAKTTAALLFRIWLRASTVGVRNVPRQGPYVLIINHEGYLDSFLAVTLLPRRVWFLAKNSEFSSPLSRTVLRLFRTIPVRRHQIDPSVIRNALRVLRVGEPVGIFIEGERTWDGRFLPPKNGVVRFLLSAHVPIVPVRVIGSFETLPRWTTRIERRKVGLVVGAPFSLQFDADEIEAAGEFLMNRLVELGAAQ